MSVLVINFHEEPAKSFDSAIGSGKEIKFFFRISFININDVREIPLITVGIIVHETAPLRGDVHRGGTSTIEVVGVGATQFRCKKFPRSTKLNSQPEAFRRFDP
jgi:hypothetical protein